MDGYRVHIINETENGYVLTTNYPVTKEDGSEGIGSVTHVVEGDDLELLNAVLKHFLGDDQRQVTIKLPGGAGG